MYVIYWAKSCLNKEFQCAALHSASRNLLTPEDNWRAYRTVVHHRFLNSFHVCRNITLNWPRPLPYFHFFLNSSFDESSHRFGGIFCVHFQGCFCSAWKMSHRVSYQNIRCHVTEDRSNIFLCESLRAVTLISSLHLALYVANFTHVAF